MAAIVKLSNTTVGSMISAVNSSKAGASTFYDLQVEGGELEIYKDGPSRKIAMSPYKDIWVAVGASKASGSQKAILYVYRLDTKELIVEEGAATIEDAATNVGGFIHLGQWGTSEQLQALYAAGAMWGSVLSKANFEELFKVAYIKDWLGVAASNVKGLWMFNQPSLDTPVTDLTGGGANQVSRTGTELVDEEPPIPYEPSTGTPIKGSRRKERYVLDPTKVTLRHIKQGTSASPGARQVLGVYYYPDSIGLNGDSGFQSGNYERRLNEEGTFSIKLPNTVGQDGVLHRERFGVISEDNFRPGDEFIEIWRGKELLFVGAPVSYNLGFTEISISGYSAFWLLKKSRETAAGYWANAPRDAMEHYLSLWQAIRGTDFDGWVINHEPGYQTTPDGEWSYANCEMSSDGSKLIMKPTAGEGEVCVVKGTNLSSAPSYGLAGDNPHRCLRVETRLKLTNFKKVGFKTPIIYLEMDSGETIMSLEPTGIRCFVEWKEGGGNEFIKQAVDENGTYHLAIERRDRWVYFYVNGKLVSIIKGTTKTIKVDSFSLVIREAEPTVEVSLLLLRGQRSFLFNSNAPGDYKLPGAPTAGGLEGNYHLDQDIWGSTSATEIKIGKLLHPTREIDPASSESGGLYQRRLDKIINFPTETPTKWQPPGPPTGERFSCRWVGAVYLNLDEFDFGLRATCDDRCRIWVGKTRLGEEYLEDWTEAGHGDTTTTGKWLKAGNAVSGAPSGSSGVLAGQGSGWYPIIIEYSNGTGPGSCTVQFTRSDKIGSWGNLGASEWAGGTTNLPKLSPLGLFRDNIQFESHYEAFQKIASTFGYQWIEAPQSLESGVFPGYVAPVSRVGRDTEYTLDSIEATEMGNQGNADDVADAILAEAQGLGDPSQSSQITIEVFNLPSQGTLYFAQEQESLSDLGIEALVLQRAQSLLALHAAPWEEIGAKPQGKRTLVDKFPLSGSLAEFKWDPGDGIRLDFPEVNVVDEDPRQIQGINWGFVPDGLGVPIAAFKNRPRNLKETLRRMLRGSIASQRNYQGQLVKVVGQLGGNSGAQDSDAYSRCPMPANIEDIVRATFVVLIKGDTSEWEIEVNGTKTGVKFTTSGRFDITPWVARDANNPRFYARGLGGTSTVEVQVELLIRV